MNKLVLNSLDSGENLAFEVFEHGTTTCGDIAHLVGQVHLLDSSHGVATTHSGKATLLTGIGNALCDMIGTFGKSAELEDTGRTVPEDGLARHNDLADSLAALGTAVHALPTIGNLTTGNNLGVSIVAKLIANDTVNGQIVFHAFLVHTVHKFTSQIELVILADAVANLATKSLGESVTHATDDNHVVDFVEQIEIERFRSKGEGELEATFIHKDGYEEDLELEYITFDRHVLVRVRE